MTIRMSLTLQMTIFRITLERQIQMQNQMRERMVAQQIAGAREMFLWLGSFYVLAGTGMIMGFARYSLFDYSRYSNNVNV